MTEFITPYPLSKDYGLAFELICKGLELVCFVDYDFSRDGRIIVRDIARIRRFKEWDIMVVVRGITYWNISDYWKKEGSGSIDHEAKTFHEFCKKSNLEFIDPRVKK